jgi:hypothetical protein
MTTRYLPLAAAILICAVSAHAFAMGVAFGAKIRKMALPAMHAGTTGDFDLVNETGRTIVGVAVSTPSDNRWHPIQGEVIDPGETTHVAFNHPGFPCHQQLRLEFNDGVVDAFTDGFDLCHTSYIRITTDPDGTDTAHYR